jgi:hypothetical protein
MTGDTTDITDEPTTFFNFGTLTVDVAGIGLATFTDSTSVVANQATLEVGFADHTRGLAILFTSNPSLSIYDLSTDIGPLLGVASYNAGLPFLTDDGLFVLNSIPGSATFIATTGVPEPGALALLSVGLAGFAALGLMQRYRGLSPQNAVCDYATHSLKGRLPCSEVAAYARGSGPSRSSVQNRNTRVSCSSMSMSGGECYVWI